MLKIKNNVDLKELEKFGFEHERLIYVKEIKKKSGVFTEEKTIYIDEKNRDISIGQGLFNTDIELDTIYNLIKADLVEKVDD